MNMVNPSCLPSHSLDEENATRLVDLKAKLEAEMQEVAERKAQKEQEWREQKECEHRELQEALVVKDQAQAVHIQAHLMEEVEQLMKELRDIWRAAAEKAWRRAEEQHQAEVAGKRAAVLQIQAAARAASEAVGSEQGGLSETEAEGNSGEDEPALGAPKSAWRWIVISRQNTAEVVIIQLSTKRKGPAEAVGATKVSPHILGRCSVS